MLTEAAPSWRFTGLTEALCKGGGGFLQPGGLDTHDENTVNISTRSATHSGTQIRLSCSDCISSKALLRTSQSQKKLTIDSEDRSEQVCAQRGGLTQPARFSAEHDPVTPELKPPRFPSMNAPARRTTSGQEGICFSQGTVFSQALCTPLWMWWEDTGTQNCSVVRHSSWIAKTLPGASFGVATRAGKRAQRSSSRTRTQHGVKASEHACTIRQLQEACTQPTVDVAAGRGVGDALDPFLACRLKRTTPTPAPAPYPHATRHRKRSNGRPATCFFSAQETWLSA